MAQRQRSVKQSLSNIRSGTTNLLVVQSIPDHDGLFAGTNINVTLQNCVQSSHFCHTIEVSLGQFSCYQIPAIE